MLERRRQRGDSGLQSSYAWRGSPSHHRPHNLACHYFRHLDCSLTSELVEETFTICRPVRGAEHIVTLRTHLLRSGRAVEVQPIIAVICNVYASIRGTAYPDTILSVFARLMRGRWMRKGWQRRCRQAVMYWAAVNRYFSKNTSCGENDVAVGLRSA